jgi:hypothetical protein
MNEMIKFTFTRRRKMKTIRKTINWNNENMIFINTTFWKSKIRIFSNTYYQMNLPTKTRRTEPQGTQKKKEEERRRRKEKEEER